LLPILGSHINIQNTKYKKIQKNKKILKWEEHKECTENRQRLVEEDKISKIKKLTIQFWLMKTLLTRKIQFRKKNSKLDF